MVLFVIMALAATAVALIVTSSRPDLFNMDLRQYRSRAGTRMLAWPTLGSPEAMQEMLGSLIQMPGYIIPLAGNWYGERVDVFLLVPDPGNWVHGPHLDPDEVVVVQMGNQKKVPLLERRAVWVCGVLGVAPMKTGNLNAVYRIKASDVWPLDGDQSIGRPGGE